MNETRRCLYCQSFFFPSRHRPQQRVCSRPDCQRQRRANSQRASQGIPNLRKKRLHPQNPEQTLGTTVKGNVQAYTEDPRPR